MHNLIEKNISLSSYFISNLPIFRIDYSLYPKIHSNEETLILSCKDLFSPQAVLGSYDILFKDCIDEKDKNKKLIEYYVINLPYSISKGDPT